MLVAIIDFGFKVALEISSQIFHKVKDSSAEDHECAISSLDF